MNNKKNIYQYIDKLDNNNFYNFINNKLIIADINIYDINKEIIIKYITDNYRDILNNIYNDMYNEIKNIKFINNKRIDLDIERLNNIYNINNNDKITNFIYILHNHYTFSDIIKFHNILYIIKYINDLDIDDIDEYKFWYIIDSIMINHDIKDSDNKNYIEYINKNKIYIYKDFFIFRKYINNDKIDVLDKLYDYIFNNIYHNINNYIGRYYDNDTNNIDQLSCGYDYIDINFIDYLISLGRYHYFMINEGIELLFFNNSDKYIHNENLITLSNFFQNRSYPVYQPNIYYLNLYNPLKYNLNNIINNII